MILSIDVHITGNDTLHIEFVGRSRGTGFRSLGNSLAGGKGGFRCETIIAAGLIAATGLVAAAVTGSISHADKTGLFGRGLEDNFGSGTLPGTNFLGLGIGRNRSITALEDLQRLGIIGPVVRVTGSELDGRQV